MPWPLWAAAAAFAVHAAVPATAAAIFHANGNEAALGAFVVLALADAPLIPLFKWIVSAAGDTNAGVAPCVLASFFLGGLMHATVAAGLTALLRRAMRS